MRVLIVEQSAYLAEALRHVLERLGGFVVLAQATSRVEVDEALLAWQPELVVLELNIPPLPNGEVHPEHGMKVLRMLGKRVPSPRTLVFSSLSERMWLRHAAQAGAMGFVSKQGSASELIAALRAIQAGHVAFTLAQQRHLLDPLVAISKREQQVLSLLGSGLSNREIAERLGISIGTVRKHMEHLYTAFDVHTRGRLIALAHREGLLVAGIEADRAT